MRTGPVTGRASSVVYPNAVEIDLPALGYTTLEARPVTGPVRIWGTLRTGPLSAENEHLALSVNSNGTIDLSDKETGRTYRGLLAYAEDGEVGDGWFHIAPIADELITSAASACEVGVVADGPLAVTFRLRTRLRVPAAFDWGSHRRSSERAEMVITTDVTLKKGRGRSSCRQLWTIRPGTTASAFSCQPESPAIPGGWIRRSTSWSGRSPWTRHASMTKS